MTLPRARTGRIAHLNLTPTATDKAAAQRLAQTTKAVTTRRRHTRRRAT